MKEYTNRGWSILYLVIVIQGMVLSSKVAPINGDSNHSHILQFNYPKRTAQPKLD